MADTLTLIAQAKDQITGPVTAAADAVQEQFERIKGAVDDVERAQRDALRETERARRQAKDALGEYTDAEVENLEKLRDAYGNAKGVVGDFGGFIESAFTKGAPGLSLVLDLGGKLAEKLSAGAQAIMTYAKHAADAGDAAFTAGQRLGVTAEFVTATTVAATQAGTSWEAVEKGIAKLAQNVNSGAKIIEELGIKATDSTGRVKSMEEIFYEAADAVAKTENDMLRLARTQELFGRGSRELVPLLMGGRAGLAEMRAEAERLGLVIDNEAAAAADRLNDELELVERTADGTARTFGSLFVPGITEGARGVVEMNAGLSALVRELGPDLESAATGAGVIFRELGEAAGWVMQHSQGLNQALEIHNDLVLNLVPGVGILRQALDAGGEALSFFAGGADEAADAEAKLQEATELTSAALKEQEERAKDLEKALRRSQDVADRALKRVREEFERTQKAQQAKLDADENKEIDAALKRLAKEQEIQDESKQAEIDAADEAAGAVESMQNENAVALDKLRDKAAEKENKRDEEALKRARKIASDVFDANKKKAESAKQEMARIQATAVQAAQSILGAFASAFAGASDGAKTFGDGLGDVMAKLFGVDRDDGRGSFGTAFNGFTGLLGRVASGGKSFLGFSEGGLVPKRFAEGGFVTGGQPGRDSVPALLMPGEYVLPKRVVDVIRTASPNMSGRFASGGLVRSGYVRPDDHGYGGMSYGTEDTLNDIGQVADQFGPLGKLVGGILRGKAAQGAAERAAGIEAARQMRDDGYKFGNVDRYSGGTARAFRRTEPRNFQQIVMLGGGEAGLVRLERDHRSIAQNRIERNQLTQHQDRANDRSWWRTSLRR